MANGIADSGAMWRRDGQRVLEGVEEEGVLTPRRARVAGSCAARGMKKGMEGEPTGGVYEVRPKQMREDGSSHPRTRPCTGRGDSWDCASPQCLGFLGLLVGHDHGLTRMS